MPNLTVSGSPTYNADGTTTINSTGADRVQAPASLIDETQAWVAMRIRVGFNATDDPYSGASMYAFGWGDNSTNRIGLRYSPAVDKWSVRRQSGAAATGADLGPVQTFVSGDFITLVFAWTASELKLKINSGAFAAFANTAIPTLAATTFDIGDAGGAEASPPAFWINSDYDWFAAGIGTLSETDGDAIYALGGGVKTLANFPGSPTMVWNATDATYLEPGATTFGETNILPYAFPTVATELRVFKFTLPESGNVSKLTIYVGASSSGAFKMKGLLYADAAGVPGAKLGETPEVTVAAGAALGWVDMMFSSPVALTATDYWIGFLGDTANGLMRFVDNGSQAVKGGVAFASGGPNPMGTLNATSAHHFSVYATYTPTSAPTAPSTSRWGISTGDPISYWTEAQRDDYYARSYADGFRRQRIDVDTGVSGDRYDLHVTDALAAGHKVLAVIRADSSFSAAAYASRCTAVANFNRHRITEYQLMNEQNLPKKGWANGAAYAAVAKAGAQAILDSFAAAGLPTPVIHLGSIAAYGDVNNTEPYAPRNWLSSIYSLAGGHSWWHVLDYHPYGFGRDKTGAQAHAFSGGWPLMFATNPSLRSIMDANGDSAKKINVTEHGAPTWTDGWSTDWLYATGDPNGMFEADAAEMMRLAVEDWKKHPTAGDLYFYSYKDRSPEEVRNGREGHFGWYRTGYVRKTGYGAVLTAIAQNPTVAPVNTVLPKIVGVAEEGREVTADRGVWSNDPTSYAYQWKRGGTNISGATSSAYMIVAADVGQSLTVTVTATNAAGSTAATSAAVTPTAALARPANSGGANAPAVTGTAQVGSTLTCSQGTWTGTAPITYTYQWQRDTAGDGVYTNIAGATSSTYVLTPDDHADRVRCQVTGTNAYGAATATSNAVGPVTTVAPVNTAAPTITGTPTVGSTLTASTGTWSNAPASYTYQWKRAGTNITGANGKTYVPVAADVGSTLTVTVTATNLGGSNSATSAATAAVTAAAISNFAAARPGFLVEIEFDHDPFGISFDQATLAAKPYSYYRLEENPSSYPATAADASGNSRHGSFQIAFAGYRQAGPITGDTPNYAIQRTAAGWLQIKSPPGSMFGSGASLKRGFTFMCWVMRQGTQPSDARYQGIGRILRPVDLLGGDRVTPMVAITENGELLLEDPGGVHGGGGYNSWATVPGKIPLNVWKLAAVVWKPASEEDETLGEWRLYVDGAFETTTGPVVTTNINRWGDEARLGDSSYDFVGKLARPAVFPLALGDGDIRRIADAAPVPPLAAATWTDVTPYVRAVGTGRGRSNELDRAAPGTGTVTLDAIDRRFEPEYAGSPHHPNIIPGRRTRVRTSSGAAVYDGHVERWPIGWTSFRRTQNDLELTDVTGAFGTWTVTAYRPAELSGARINALLDMIGWPADRRSIDPGQQTIVEHSLADESVFPHILEVTATENGLFYISPDGKAVFHDGAHRTTNPRSIAPQAVFGDHPSELPYLTLSPEYDLQRVVNEVVTTVPANPHTGVYQQTFTASDAVSQRRYGRRTLSRTTLHYYHDAAKAQGEALLAARKDPKLLFREMTLEPARHPALAAAVLAMELSDRIIVRRRPYIGGATLERQVFVERVQHSIQLTPGRPTKWTATVALSPV